MTTEHFGRYQIKSEIGRGGMATVYHAYDPNFERDVAIKVLPQVFLHDPLFRARFEREAKMIALLEHPAIVPVYDFGDQDGQPYIVMRYMAGGSLAERLSQGSMSFEDTAQLISRLAPALDAAHARGIIHRDLKPGNILFDQYGNAFLSDFGIARLVQNATATLTGEAIVGTPAYMSPEQIKGDKDVDGRSDIYALGVLIYQMLTGSAPYQADTPAKVMMMHVLEPVPVILNSRANLPPGCETVIAKAMAKEPQDRYKTSAELAGALDTISQAAQAGKTMVAQTNERTLAAGRTVMPAGKTQFQPEPRAGSTPVPSRRRVAPLLPAKSRPAWLGIAILAAALVGGGVLLVGGLALLGLRGGGPLAMLSGPEARLTNTTGATPILAVFASPTANPPSESPSVAPALALTTIAPASPTLQPTEAPTVTSLPTDTPEPSSTSTATATPEPKVPVIGGADKIGFIMGGDVWVANLDGSELTQLTDDPTEKLNLQWSPDGESLVYISEKCVNTVYIADGRIDQIICFNYVDSLKAFEISPDGSQVAISLDNQMYIVPYDIPTLNQITTRSGLTDVAVCKDFAPFLRSFVTMVRWSQDGNVLAARLITNLGNGQRGDQIQLFAVDLCIPNPRPIDNFPAQRFTVKDYEKNPLIQNYSWDGLSSFAFTNIVRNEGFGDLYIYNSELHKARLEVNPIEDVCCYRDPQWSPDGSHLILAFQNYLGGANSITQLYIIPFDTLGTSAQYDPLPLPEISDPRERPQPVLRPAR